MKIIILTATTSTSAAGGVERFSSYLAECFSEHDVHMLGIESLAGWQRSLIKLSRFIGMQQPVFGYCMGTAALRNGFDVCITNGMLGWNIKNRKVINVQHGTFAKSADRIDAGRNMLKFFIKKYVWGHFERCAARRATQCIAVSREVQESVRMYYRVADVQVIPNAVDTDRMKPLDKARCREAMNLPSDTKIALFVGRFEYAKGKPILEGLRQLLAERGDILIVAESYSQEELLQLYNAADLFLLPSLHEGCSYALLDAMSVGLPFLASPVGMVTDLVQQGLFQECIVPDQRIDAYAQKMDRLLDLSGEARSVLSEELRSYILKEHGLQDFKTAYRNLIRSI